MRYAIGIVFFLPLSVFAGPPISPQGSPIAIVRPAAPVSVPGPLVPVFVMPASLPRVPAFQPALAPDASLPPPPVAIDRLRAAVGIVNGRDIPTEQAVSVHPDIAHFTLVQGTRNPAPVDYAKLWIDAYRPGVPVSRLSSADRAKMDSFAREMNAVAAAYRAEWEKTVGTHDASVRPADPIDAALWDLNRDLSATYAKPKIVGIMRDVFASRAHEDFRTKPVTGTGGRSIGMALWTAKRPITIKYFYPLRGAPADGNYRDILIVNTATGHALWLPDYIKAGYPDDF